ncbi:MAG: hypothetical protein ACTHMZ_03090 [Actinomycetes bacterium]
MGRPEDDDARLHDMGGAIGPADQSGAGESRVDVATGGGHTARIHPESLAVDALDDDTRAGMYHQDETDIVQDTTGEIRDIDEDPPMIEVRD